MSFLRNLLNPPPTAGATPEHYKFFNSVNTALNALTAVPNPCILTNPDFATLSAQGTNPTTPSDGDNFEFIKDWFLVGATAADYVITATPYPSNSTVQSGSEYYVHVVVNSTNGNPFYFYQRQAGTIRKYQQNYFTYGLNIKNNSTQAVKLQMAINTFYDPSNVLKQGSTFFVQPGLNSLTSTIQVPPINGAAVGGGNYTEFKMNFVNLPNGEADLEFYLIKCEFGQISTPLQ